MSLVLAYHDQNRAVIACDARSTYQAASGEMLRAPGDFPKFCVLPNNLVVIATGRTELTQKMLAGVNRMIRDFPSTKFSELAGFLEFSARKMFAARHGIANKQLDTFATGLLGWDPEQRKMRCSWWFSESDFHAFEIQTQNDRISCAGFVEENDRNFLQAFTYATGRAAEDQEAGWIAAQLRKGIGFLHEQHPTMIDPASYFAAIDSHGRVALGQEYPQPKGAAFAAVKAAVCATIFIASFDMRVPGISDIPYNSGSITGLAYNTLYYVYTDDPGFVGGTVVYEATTSKETALDKAGRFFIGSITTPRAGGQDTKGNFDGGAGAQFGILQRLQMSATVITLTPSGGSASVTNPQQAIDNDTTTFAQASASGAATSASIIAQLECSVPPGLTAGAYSSFEWRLWYSIPTLTNTIGTCSVNVGYSLDGGNSILSAFQGLTTVGLTLFSLALPSTMNPSLFQVQISAIIPPGATGSVVCDIYETWIDATT